MVYHTDASDIKTMQIERETEPLRIVLNGWMNRHRVLFSIALLAVSAGWIWFSRPSPALSASQVAAPQQGFFAPDFTLNTFDGTPLTLADLNGKVVLINFWASWCPPCKAEMKAIENTYADLQDQGLVILGINTTYQDDLAAAARFAQSEGLTFPLLTDPEATVSKLYQVQAMPTTFLVDQQGRITWVMIGGPMPEALIRTKVQSLLIGGR